MFMKPWVDGCEFFPSKLCTPGERVCSTTKWNNIWLIKLNKEMLKAQIQSGRVPTSTSFKGVGREAGWCQNPAPPPDEPCNRSKGHEPSSASVGLFIKWTKHNISLNGREESMN